MKNKSLSKVTAVKASFAFFGVLMSLSITQAYAQNQNKLFCSAVVSANSQLYFVDQSGEVIDKFPVDTRPKYSVSVSPGSQVAYIPETNPNTVTVVDRFGTIVNYPVPESPEGQFVGVTWDYPYLLKLQYHVGPNNDIFRFFSVPYDTTSPLEEIGSAVVGRSCAAKLNEQNNQQNFVACISENKLLLNDQVIVDRDPLKAENLISLGLAIVGDAAAVATNTTPEFQIELGRVTEEIQMKVTLPDGTWAQSSVPLNKPFSVNWDDETYAFTPASIDSQGKVTINISKVKKETSHFDPAIGWALWNPDNYFAVATHVLDDEFLHVVNPTNPQQRLSVKLEDSGRIAAMHYSSSTVLMLRGSSGFSALQINDIGKDTSTLELKSFMHLPATMNIKLQKNTIPALVEDWSCQGSDF